MQSQDLSVRKGERYGSFRGQISSQGTKLWFSERGTYKPVLGYGREGRRSNMWGEGEGAQGTFGLKNWLHGSQAFSPKLWEESNVFMERGDQEWDC